MGIQDLWKVLGPAAERVSLTELIVSEALERTREGKGLPVIGIDASPLMFQAQGAVHRARQRGGSMARLGRNAEYSCLVAVLQQWIRVPAIPIIVFDGTNRPHAKRTHQVRQGREHTLSSGFRKLINAFGFHEYTAPGEAEAELAALSQRGHIDYVLTSDSDVFLFGARSVIRSPQLEGNRDIVEIYRSEAISQLDPSGGLSPKGILLLAVLSGGDYNPAGLPGCGFQTAYTLAQTTELPGLLEEAIRGREPTTFEVSVALSEWRAKLRLELSGNPSLRRKLPALASAIPETFPDPKIVDQYAHPVTSFNSEGRPLLPNLDLKYPDSGLVVKLSCHLLEWQWPRIFKMLEQSIWPGHCMREILHEQRESIPIKSGYSSTTGMGRQAMRYICKYGTTHQPGSLAPLPYSSVEMWISNVQVPALKAYNQVMKISHPDSTEVLRTSASVWIPYEIVRFTYPELVTQYQNEHPAASTSGQACDAEANQSASTSGCGSQGDHQARHIIDLTVGPNPVHFTVSEAPQAPAVIEIIDD